MHREGQNCSRIPDGSGVHLKQAALLQDVSTLRMCADKGVVHRFALLGALVVAATSLAAPSLGRSAGTWHAPRSRSSPSIRFALEESGFARTSERA